MHRPVVSDVLTYMNVVKLLLSFHTFSTVIERLKDQGNKRSHLVCLVVNCFIGCVLCSLGVFVWVQSL